MAPTRIVDACGVASAVCWAWLALESRRPGMVGLPALFTVLAVTWVCAICAWRLGWKMHPGPVLARGIVWGAVFRSIGLLGEPILEDDHNRYLWEGRQFALTGNPYGSRPADAFDDPAVEARFQTILDRINHPELPTVYGPVAQYGFLASYWIAPGELWPWKSILLAADAAAGVLLWKLGAGPGILLFAWCPLSIQETAFSAHPDALGATLVLAAWFALRRNPAWAGAAGAAALGVKITAAVPLLLLLARAPRRSVAAAAGTILAIQAPFWWRGSGPEGLAVFASHWEFNSSIFGLLAAATGAGIARWICAPSIAACVLLVGWHARQRGLSSTHMLAALGALFLLSPVVNPWYLLWMLPFAILRSSLTTLTAFAAVSLSYVRGMSLPESGLGPFDHPVWVRFVEYGVIAFAAFLEWRWKLADCHSREFGVLETASNVSAPMAGELPLPSAGLHGAHPRLFHGITRSSHVSHVGEGPGTALGGASPGSGQFGGSVHRW